jgi:hypothetical protein
MNTYPNAPQVAKASLVSISPNNPVPSIVVLQYNPAELTRTVTPQYEKTGQVPVGTEQLAGPPAETISLTATLSAIDQLEAGSPLAATMGIHPQLSALETLMFPSCARIIADQAQMLLGVLEIVPPESPLTVFVWGAKRVLPVQITSYSVTETLHDPQLNPINAEVQLSLSVLNYQDFTPTQAGYYVYMANLALRESMALVGEASQPNLPGIITSVLGMD